MPISNLSNGLRTGVCTSTNRPTTPYEGQVIYETDTDLSYIYNGSSWQQVSGGTAVGNSGLVYVTEATAATAASLSVNNCFSSTHVNYFIRWNGKSSANDVAFSLRFRASGTDTSSADYKYTNQQQYVGIGAVGVSGSNAATSISLGNISSSETDFHVQIANPQVAKISLIGSEGINVQTAYSNGIDAYRAQGFLNNSTAYDGFTLFPASGTITGTVYVYGYRNS